MDLLALLVAAGVVLVATLAATVALGTARQLREQRRIAVETARTVARLHQLRHDAEAEMLRVTIAAFISRRGPR